MAVAMSVNYYTVNGMILAEDRGGVYSEFVPDTLGSCVAVKDASENITYTADYWPYGEVRTSTGSKSSPWGFVGLLGYLTDIAKRLYVRARHYRPNIGQWQTVDPLWPNQSAYGYGNESPSSFTDPSGRNAAVIIGGGVLLGAGILVIAVGCWAYQNRRGIGNALGDMGRLEIGPWPYPTPAPAPRPKPVSDTQPISRPWPITFDIPDDLVDKIEECDLMCRTRSKGRSGIRFYACCQNWCENAVSLARKDLPPPPWTCDRNYPGIFY